ncbi:ABC transporter B family member 20-like protein [Drosera capensis]
MMISRGLFGWSPPHIQPLTPVSEVSEPPESPSPYTEANVDAAAMPGGVEVEEEEMDDVEEIEPPPAAVPFSRLFACADRIDWVLMSVGSVAAAAHGTALVLYLHYFAKILGLLSEHWRGGDEAELMNRFNELVLIIVYIAAGVFAAGWIEVSCWILTGERQTAVIRSKYVQVLLNQDMSFFDTYGNNGDIVSQVLSDVLLIQSALSEKVGNYIHNMATFFSGLVIGFINCWQIALITLATGPFIVAAGGISNIFLHRLAENIQDAYAEAASIAEQAVSYARTLYAFTNETLAKYSYATSLQATLRYGILISLVQGLGLGFTYGLAICSCALQLWVGTFLVTHGKAHGGEIIAALFTVILSGLGLNQAATNFYSFEQGRIAAYRLFEMISRSTSTVNQEGNTLASVQGNIEFRNVYFSYLSRPEIPILSGFYLSVPAKKTVALVGRNGSGKSSIIPLMERFYDPTLGEVLLDGENIKNLQLEWLRSQIGLVTQEPALLSLSIRENIAYGRSATQDQIEEAAKIAHAHTFISSLEKGYDTQVGRAGLALTEEQKIKLSIARAVLSNPSILLLDEVTGGLDFEAEKAVQAALDLLMLGRSTIIIARRLSLIRNADYIAVMEEGQLVEMGTHDELLNLGGLYAELLKCEEAAKLPRSSLEKGYDTQVGRAGLALTEEQKIKLSIARAVLSNPSILLLDEVTGGLDFEAEKAVQAALELLMLGRSTIIIARRLSLIRNADYIAVMEEGQLVEMGTHDELLNLDGLYAELLKCEEAAKLPRRMPVRTYKEAASFPFDSELSVSQSFQESNSPKMAKSPSLQRVSAVHAFRAPDAAFNSFESPKVRSPPPEQLLENGASLDEMEKGPSITRQDSFEMRLPGLPKIEVQLVPRQISNASDPESPVSPLLTSDPKNQRSHSQTFSRPESEYGDVPIKVKGTKDPPSKSPPSFWRLVQLSLAEWLYAVLGSTGAAIFGSFNPLLAYIIALIVTAYYRFEEGHHIRHEVHKWCLIIACMGVVTVVANFLQHFYFGIMGEKMTERVRRMMFSAMLRNEVGWFDDEENSADTLSMRLANDATFVRAAFSNRLSIFIQDSAAVIVAILIGMLLQWRLALLALGTLPILTISAVAQKLWLAGFSKGIQEMHRKASLVLEDAVRNIYTVVAFCAGNKVMELYRFQLKRILKKSFLHGMAIGFFFGFSQFLLFACNALLLWYTGFSVKNKYMDLPTAIKEYMVFSFATFALVEPFGLAPYILKRRKSLISVFEIIDRVPKIDPDDSSAIKPPNVYGSLEFKNVDFCYPTRPEILVLSNFSLKVNGGQTVAVVGVSGSGKSTIISLIERFYDPVAGFVFLDGRDLKQYNLRWLRSQLGLVQQEPMIFSTTIRENIIYARHNATEAELKEAARIANAHHFISSLPQGYDTHVGMRGTVLTPGQKQRIAIARVVLKNAPILLLDEASSAIESESSRVVQEALDTLIMGNKTTIIVAHRAAMMKHVDNIVVLNGSRIVEEGSHDNLVAKNGLYVRLMQPHFAKGLRQHRLI